MLDEFFALDQEGRAKYVNDLDKCVQNLNIIREIMPEVDKRAGLMQTYDPTKPLGPLEICIQPICNMVVTAKSAEAREIILAKLAKLREKS